MAKMLSNEDLEYISSYTAISKDEVKEQFENFLKENPKGKMTKNHFKHFWKKCFPDVECGELIEHVFRMCDMDNNAKIDFREFIVLVYVMSNGTAEENLKRIFRLFDIDGNGFMSKKELTKIIKHLFHLFKKEEKYAKMTEKDLASEAFKEMDTNTDGKVSEDEFIRACLNHNEISTMLALKIIDIFI